MVYNGLDYYALTLPRKIASMSWNCAAVSNLIKDAFNIINKVHFLLPTLTACESLAKSLKFMRAVNVHLEGTSLATGTSCDTSLPVEVPIPKPLSSQRVAKMVYKCAASMLSEAPPEKKKNESDEAFTL